MYCTDNVLSMYCTDNVLSMYCTDNVLSMRALITQSINVLRSASLEFDELKSDLMNKGPYPSSELFEFVKKN